MSVLMQSRASFANGKAVGVDEISSEILQALPWRAVQKTKTALETRYKGCNKEDIETFSRDVIVLRPKKNGIDRHEAHTRGICVQSVLAEWCCGCLTKSMEMELKNIVWGNKSWEDIHTFGFEEGRSATEIATAIRFMASTAHEWCNELGSVCGFHGCEAGLLEINPVLAEAILGADLRNV